MSVMDLNDDDQYAVLSIVAGVLHLGNIDFIEHGNYASVRDRECTYPSFSQYFHSTSLLRPVVVAIVLIVMLIVSGS